MNGWNFDLTTPPGATGRSDPRMLERRRTGALRLNLQYDAGRWHGARINTRGILEFTRGRARFDVTLPRDTGVWAALWTMADPWPDSGEYDLVETGMPDADHYVQTIHAVDQYGQFAQPLATQDAPARRYTLERDGRDVRWFVGGLLVATHPDAAPDTPHWLCADLMAWAAHKPDERFSYSLTLNQVSVTAL